MENCHWQVILMVAPCTSHVLHIAQQQLVNLEAEKKCSKADEMHQRQVLASETTCLHRSLCCHAELHLEQSREYVPKLNAHQTVM